MTKKKKRVVKRKPKCPTNSNVISDDICIPNHSGMLDAGKVHRVPTDNLDPVNKKYVDDEITGKAWLLATNQTGITGDKTGTFNLTTTGEGGFGGLMPYDSATFDLGSVGLKWRNLMLSGDITTLGNITATGTGTFGDVLIGAQSLTPLIDNTVADALHRHSELVAPDGSPDPAVQVDNDGKVGMGLSPSYHLDIGNKNANISGMRFDLIGANKLICIEDTDARSLFLCGGTSTGGEGSYIRVFGEDFGGVNNHGGISINTAGNANANNFIQFGTALGTVFGKFNQLGNFAIGNHIPTQPLDVKAKAGMSAIGGHLIKLTNKTGGNTVAGELVQVDTTTNEAFDTCDESSDGCFAVILDGSVSDGSEAWVVVGGIADVLIDEGGCTRGDRMITSATSGSAATWNVGGAVATHFQEIGHCIETRVGAGLARCVLHFN